MCTGIMLRNDYTPVWYGDSQKSDPVTKSMNSHPEWSATVELGKKAVGTRMAHTHVVQATLAR